MALHALQQSVNVHPRVAVVEADDEPQSDQVVRQGIGERAPEGIVRKRPAHGVNDPVERL